jgi:hypothetical protein
VSAELDKLWTRAVERLEARSTETDSGCVVWTGATDHDGYGLMSFWDPTARRTKTYRAHRVALERKLGRRLGPREFACHACDNPSCVNPDHLWAGSPADNTHDASAKGRLPRGTQHQRARFTENDVREIRAMLEAGTSAARVAKWFGCSISGVEHIKYGRVWSWL